MAAVITMRRLISKLLCLIAALTLMDGHIVVLQSYAWVTMLQDRIPEQGVTEALVTTFDGEHPCAHCLAAQQLQVNKTQSEPEPKPLLQLSNLKLPALSSHKISLPSISKGTLMLVRETSHPAPADYIGSVPTPPPRLGSFSSPTI